MPNEGAVTGPWQFLTGGSGRWVHPHRSPRVWVLLVSQVCVCSLFPTGMLEASWRRGLYIIFGFLVSLKFHDTYLSSCYLRTLFWSLRKWDARFLYQWAANNLRHSGNTDKTSEIGVGLREPVDSWDCDCDFGWQVMSPGDNGTSRLPPQLKGEEWQTQQSLIVPNHRCLETTEKEDLTHSRIYQEALGQIISSPLIKSVSLL